MDKELQRERMKRAIEGLCNATEMLKKIRNPKSKIKIVNGVSEA